MIDYDVLCEAIERWKLGQTTPRLAPNASPETRTFPVPENVKMPHFEQPAGNRLPPRQSPTVATPDQARVIWRRHERIMATRLYELMAITMHDLELGGLWTDDRNICIVCTDPSGPPRIEAWWTFNSSTSIPYIPVTPSAPEGYQRINRRFSEVVAAQEWAHTWDDLLLELMMQIPRDTPRFSLNRVHSEDQLPLLQLSFSGQLDEKQRSRVEQTITNSSHTLVSEIAYDSILPNLTQQPIRPHSSDSLVLHASRTLEGKISPALSHLYERDEDLWLSTRHSIFGTQDKAPASLPPHLADPSKSRCLVDCRSFAPSDLSNYLLMYDQVILPLPTVQHYENITRALGAQDHELLSLAHKRRIVFLLPMPVHNYRLSLLQALAEQAPESLVFSRTLLGATIIDSQSRAPHLYPPLPPEGKRAFAAYLSEKSRNLPESSLNIKVLVQAIVDISVRLEERLHTRGSMALGTHGFGTWAHALYRSSSPAHAQHDLGPEFAVSGMAVQWAAALDAVLFPAETEDFSLYPMSNFMSQAYRREFGTVFSREEAKMIHLVQTKLLQRREGQSIGEFGALLGSLGKSDLNKLRRLVNNLVLSSSSMDDLEASIGKLNEDVVRLGSKLGFLNIADRAVQILLIPASILITTNPYVAPLALIMWECLRQAGLTHETLAKTWSKTGEDAVLISQTRNHFR